MRLEIVSVRKCGDHGWRVYIVDRAGSGVSIRQRIAAETEEEAWACARRVLAEASCTWTVGQALDFHIAHAAGRVSKRTLVSYRRLATIMDNLADRRLDDVSSAEIQAAIDALSVRYGASMVKKARNLLRSALRDAVSAGQIAENPAETVTVGTVQPKEPLDCDLSRLRALLMCMKGRTACAIGLALECGLALGETAGILREDYTGDELTVRWRVERRHGGKSLIFPYDEPVKRSVPEWLTISIGELEWGPIYLFSKADEPANVGSLERDARWLLSTLGSPATVGQIARLAKEADHEG